jgi:hypothetical protein
LEKEAVTAIEVRKAVYHVGDVIEDDGMRLALT